MRLYHSKFLIILAFLLLSACRPTPQPSLPPIDALVFVDGETYPVQFSPGSTVLEVLDSVGIELGSQDRVEPPTFTVLADESEITVTRIREEFEIEQVVIPFAKQTLPTELLPVGVQQLDPLQKGKDGLQEITYRIVYENGVEVSRSPIKTVIVEEPQPQVILLGVQTSYSPLPIPGRLVYFSDGNAGMMEGTTASRTPIISTGDLDGRIFSLSSDGEWLLFTRRGDSEDVINTLWAVQVTDPEVEIDLQVENVIHFADWVPGSTSRIAYSTVEPRQAAPGWQANNDLIFRNFSLSGWVARPEIVIETNSGGVYGWWGTFFDFAPDGSALISVEPDVISFLDLNLETQTTLLKITPYQTRSDWAWVPGARLSPDQKVLYIVNHAPPLGAVAPEESQNFDLIAIPLEMGTPVSLASQVGMFAYPLPSPIQILPSGENAYQVAYLQAAFPTQSESSKYRLMIMDRDGSNQSEVFPASGSPGIQPQANWGVWSPQPMGINQNNTLAVLYQGNIWLVDTRTGEYSQITGDGRISRLDWK